ncbi:MAG: UbiA family prenyltransferase, partial [Lentisphaeraceae bacterium]|nr:UbiA family prenyltransferase [Lentisphaeraceae bacterium]
MPSTKKNKLHSWLQLIRIPNLFTVPGDILAGHACVTLFSDFSLWRFALLCLCSALLYCGGLILNDCLDYNEDCRERPKRPLPSGAISVRDAYLAWITSTILALIICWFLSAASFYIALILTTLIILYNGPARKFPGVAFVIMGLCRGFNLLLGASTAISTSD